LWRISTLAKRRTRRVCFAHTSYSVLGGLAVHALFDGVAIGSGFAINSLLGLADFPGDFAAQGSGGFHDGVVMLASGKRAGGMALSSAVVLAAATLLGVLVIGLIPGLVRYGLPVSAGVALYVAATDLVPEVNREPGIRMALVFFAGVAGFLLLRILMPAV
jgi:zinc transporter ZupT